MKKRLTSLLLTLIMIMSQAVVIVNAEDFTVDSGKMLTPSDLAVLTKNVEFEGRTGVVECNSAGKTAAIRYDNINMSASDSAANRYLLIDIYYKKANATTTQYGLNVTFRSTVGSDNGDNWTTINQQPNSVKKASSDTSALPNRWETVAIDCQPALEYLSENSLTLKQMQIGIPATTGTDRVYISAVRFSNSTGSGGSVDSVYLSVMQTVNDGNAVDLVKILSNDSEFAAHYASLSGKGLYLEEIDEGAISVDTFAANLIAKKPSGEGYTAENFVLLFNETVAEAVFAGSDADEKITVIENPRYSGVLNTESIVTGKAYISLSGNSAKNSIFDGLGNTGFADDLRKNVIILALNNAANETVMQEIIEESASVIPISFTAEYAAFSDEQKATLYDGMMLQKPYIDYADVAAKFDTAYNDVKNAPLSTVFTLRRSKIVTTASDLPTYTTVDFGGKNNVMKFADTNSVTTKGIRYDGFNMGTEYSSVNKTLLVDCYLEDEGASTFSLGVVFRHVVNGNKWINSEPTSTRTSGNYIANSWVTVAIDCQIPLNYLVTKGYILDQIQINIPATTGNFYVGDVKFTTDEVPYEATKTYILDRSKIVEKNNDNPDLPSYETVDFGGKTGVMKFENIRLIQTKAIRYDNLNLGTAAIGSSGYLLVNCYLEDDDRSEFGLTASFRQVVGGKWITSEAVSTQNSPAYPANKWVTVAIDCTKFLEYLESNSYSIKQLQINLPDVRGNIYVGEVKFTGFAEAASIDLYDGDNKCEWKDGSIDAKITFADDFASREITAYAVRYEIQSQKLVAADIQQKKQVVTAGETIDIPLSVSNSAGSYMKVIVVDNRNKPICDAKIFGNAPVETFETKTDKSRTFYLNETEYQGSNIKISGEENSSPYAIITAVIKNDSEVLFADQKKVNDKSGFVFEFDGKNAFASNGTPNTPSGTYTAYISSDFSDEVLNENIGIAGETPFGAALATINSSVKSDIVDLLTKDTDNTALFLQYVSLASKDLYIEEISENGIQSTVADLLISRKPDGTGYTADNIKAIFNKAVTEIIFASATADEKYNMVKNERYSTALGTETIGSSKTYEMLAENLSKGTIFSGLSLSDTDFADKLAKNVILLALNSAENGTKIKDIILENATVIPITFASDYASFNSEQIKYLYNNMLAKKPFADYADVISKFNEAYTATKNASLTPVVPSAPGGGGGGGGFSVSAASVISGENSISSGGKSKFSDVESLTWGKNEINALTNLGIISGISDDEFAPDDSITREQFCRLIAEAYQIKGTADVPFADIDDDAWYAEAVKALYANNLISGISAETFGVGGKITRQDAAVILYNVIKNKLVQGYVGKNFNDEESISDYAKAAVSAMSSAGIINGYDDNTFGSKKEITRREAAIVLYRALELGR